jgi:ribulose-phosphate 3-epimerase
MILAASILSADFTRLGAEVDAAARGGASVIHVDVMDGHFVPNLSVGPPVVRAVRRATRLPIDVHLMLSHPEHYLDAFADAGAQWLSVHIEAQPNVQRNIDLLRSRGVRAGVALNPATPLSAIDEILPDLDFVLIMSVSPGFGGQPLLPRALDKVRALRQRLGERGLGAQIEIDGGIDASNVRRVIEAGADVIVAGASVFAEGDAEAGARHLLAAARSDGRS